MIQEFPTNFRLERNAAGEAMVSWDGIVAIDLSQVASIERNGGPITPEFAGMVLVRVACVDERYRIQVLDYDRFLKDWRASRA